MSNLSRLFEQKFELEDEMIEAEHFISILENEKFKTEFAIDFKLKAEVTRDLSKKRLEEIKKEIFTEDERINERFNKENS